MNQKLLNAIRGLLETADILGEDDEGFEVYTVRGPELIAVKRAMKEVAS